MSEFDTVHVQRCLDRLKAGDSKARDELLKASCGRLETLTRRMLRNYQCVQRWEQTGDVLQNTLLRLWSALDGIVPPTPLDFYRLAATAIRRELIDLARHYMGPQGRGAHHASVAAAANAGDGEAPYERVADLANEPFRLAQWTEFHEQVERLPAEDREVFEMLWYQGLEQEEAAQLLGVTSRTVRNRWRNARIALHDALGGSLPEE